MLETNVDDGKKDNKKLIPNIVRVKVIGEMVIENMLEVDCFII